jgi:hypothetical protein
MTGQVEPHWWELVVEGMRQGFEHSFFRIRKLTSEDSRFYWEVTSKDGTQYQYGRTAEARMDDPADANHIFSWNLETVRDVQGNTIKYQYEKTSTPAREIYLKRIFYASNGDLSAPHVIDFITEEGRPDIADSYAVGFRTRLSKRLSAVDVLSLVVRQRRYELMYDRSEASGASILSKVTQTDSKLEKRLPSTVPKVHQCFRSVECCSTNRNRPKLAGFASDLENVLIG